MLKKALGNTIKDIKSSIIFDLILVL